MQTKSGVMWLVIVCSGDSVAEPPCKQAGSAGEYAMQGVRGLVGMLLVCRFFANAQNDRKF